MPGEGPVAFLRDGTPVQFSADASKRLAMWRAGQRIPPDPLRTNSPSTAGSRDGLPYLEPTALRFFTLTNGETIGGIASLALTPDGASVAASGTNTEGRTFLAVWNGATGRLLSRPVDTLPSIPNGGESWGWGEEVRIRTELPPASALALTPDSSLLAVGNDEGEVTIWRVSTASVGQRVPPASLQTNFPSPAGSRDGLPSATDSRPLLKISAGRLPIRSLAFCRDYVCDPLHPPPEPQWLLATGDSGGGVRIWEVTTGKLRTKCLGAGYDIFALAFGPDGTLLAFGGVGASAVWDTASGQAVLSTDLVMFRDIAFSPDGSKIATSFRRGSDPVGGSVFALEPARGIRSLRGLSGQVTRICFSNDGRLLAAVSTDWQVALWNLSSGLLLHVFNMPAGEVTADNAGLAFSPEGSQFAFMAGTRALLLDVDSGRLLDRWPVPPGYVEELAFSPSGRLFAFHLEPTNAAARVFSRPTTARIRELLKGGATVDLLELAEFNRQVHAAAWAHDASFVIMEGVGVDGTKTSRWIKTAFPLERRVGWSRDSLLDPNHCSYLSVDAAAKAIAYVPGPGTELTDFCEPKFGNRLRSFSFPPTAMNTTVGLSCVQRRHLGPVQFYSLQDESLLLTVAPSQDKPSFNPVFSRDGRLLASGNEDGTITLFDLPKIQARLGTLKLGW